METDLIYMPFVLNIQNISWEELLFLLIQKKYN